MSFAEQKAPTSLPGFMGAAGWSPATHLLLGRMQSVCANFLPKSASCQSQEPARGAGNGFTTTHCLPVSQLLGF